MKKLSLLIALCSIFALMSCKKNTEQSIPITGITINDKAPTLALTVAESKTLQATITPKDATNNKIVWSSDDTTIATVSQTGTVVGIKAGKTKIWAKSVENNSIMDQCVVSVADQVIDITEITLNLNTLSVEIDQTKNLSATVMPQTATYRDVTWSSSDETIATVSKTGSVTGLKIGKATITVTSDTDKEKFAVCQVTVIDKSIPATDMWMKTTKLELKSGKNATLSATTIPTNATNQEMIWSSDDQTIATVDAKGLVTGINAGTTTIWVKWGGDNSIKDKCTVTILADFSYAVGDLYPDAGNSVGVVFWKDPNDPAKGKIVSLTETKAVWAKENVQRNMWDKTNGMVNMTTIKAVSNWTDLYPAFKWCSEIGDSWYLPAIDEMKEIYAARDIVNAAIARVATDGAMKLDDNKDYWTSTENQLMPQTNAVTIQFYVGFGGGGAPAGGENIRRKDGENNIRAIMKFESSKK